jgi:hypothetical protein
MTRNRSLSVERVSTVSVVADSNGDRVGSHLVADLSRGLNDSLDNRGVSHSTNSGETIGSMGDHWVSSVWEGTKNHLSISIPLDNGMGKGKSVAKTVVAKTVVAKTVAKTSISCHRGMMDHREDRRVVDQGGGCAEDCGASSNDGSIGIPLAIVAMAVAVAVVANSDRDSVGSHLMADLSRGHLNRLDDRVAGNSANRGKAEGCRCSNQWGSGVWEACVPSKEHLRVGLRGGGCRSNDCLSETVG